MREITPEDGAAYLLETGRAPSDAPIEVRALGGGGPTAVVVWGLIAPRLATPIILLQRGANDAGIVFVIAPLHLLDINTTLLPEEPRPPTSRRAALVGMALFYGAFVTLWLASLVRGPA